MVGSLPCSTAMLWPPLRSGPKLRSSQREDVAVGGVRAEPGRGERQRRDLARLRGARSRAPAATPDRSTCTTSVGLTAGCSGDGLSVSNPWIVLCGKSKVLTLGMFAAPAWSAAPCTRPGRSHRAVGGDVRGAGSPTPPVKSRPRSGRYTRSATATARPPGRRRPRRARSAWRWPGPGSGWSTTVIV